VIAVFGLPGSDEPSQQLTENLVIPGLPDYDHAMLLFGAYCEHVHPYFDIIPSVVAYNFR
jgi:hypothetical protein